MRSWERLGIKRCLLSPSPDEEVCFGAIQGFDEIRANKIQKSFPLGFLYKQNRILCVSIKLAAAYSYSLPFPNTVRIKKGCQFCLSYGFISFL